MKTNLHSLPFAGGLVLVNELQNRLHVLNEGAAAIWTLRRGLELCIAEAADMLVCHYGMTHAEADAAIAMAEQQWIDACIGRSPPVYDMASRRAERPHAPVGTDYNIDGLNFTFSSEDQETRVRVESLLRDHRVSARAPDVTLHVAVETGSLHIIEDGVERLSVVHSGEAVGAIFQAIVEHGNPDTACLVWLHAAAVTRDGVTVLLPGASGAGKSTLTAYLAGSGYRHIADDLVALDAEGRIMSWTPPMCIKSGSWPILAAEYPELDTAPTHKVLGQNVKYLAAPPPAPSRERPSPRLIVFPAWSANILPETIRLSPLTVLARLVAERLWLGYPLTPQAVGSFLDWLVDKPAYELRYSGLNEAESRLATLMRPPVASV